MTPVIDDDDDDAAHGRVACLRVRPRLDRTWVRGVAKRDEGLAAWSEAQWILFRDLIVTSSPTSTAIAPTTADDDDDGDLFFFFAGITATK